MTSVTIKYSLFDKDSAGYKTIFIPEQPGNKDRPFAAVGFEFTEAGMIKGKDCDLSENQKSGVSQ